MILRIFGLAVGGLVAAGVWSPALAGDRPVVVELFTSQGCNSCPPADAYLQELQRRQDENIIVLGFHVDYWDYLGWKDTFGLATATTRQKLYTKALGLSSVYTPQMIVNGTNEQIGADKKAVEGAIQAARENPMTGPTEVRFDRDEEGAFLRVGAATGEFKNVADVWIVLFKSWASVTIERGENAGQKVGYANVVRGIVHLGQWRGQLTRFPVPGGIVAEGADGAVALVQVKDQGPIIGAMRFRLNNGAW